MRIIGYIAIVLLLFSCKKAEERSCFKGVGNPSSEEILLSENFDTLYLKDDLIFEIIPDTLNKIELIGGRNLLNHIGVNLAQGKLQIENNNRCNFLRNLSERVTAKIHLKELHYLDYEGTSSLTFLDTLYSGELRVYNKDGAGSIHLLVDVGYLEVVIKYGWADFTVAGTSGYTYLACNTNSFCDARLLRPQIGLNVLSMTQGDMYVNAHNTIFTARIKRAGNIRFVGEPSELNLIQTGEGQLIQEKTP